MTAEGMQDRALEICYEQLRHYDRMAAEMYGKGRELDGNRYETAAEAIREVAKYIGRVSTSATEKKDG